MQRALVCDASTHSRNALTHAFSDAFLKCGVHKCPSSCHQILDHSRMECEAILNKKCAIGHNQSWRCFQTAPATCQVCERERMQAEKKAKKALEEKLKRDERIQKHQKEIEKIDDEIQMLIQSMKDMRLEGEQANIIAQKRRDLEAAKKRAQESFQMPQHHKPNNESSTTRTQTFTHTKTPLRAPVQGPAPPNPTSLARKKLRDHIKIAVSHNASASQTEWQRQKDQENAVNPAIDEIMGMVGLEEVKLQVLRIKSRVETSMRQNTDLRKERLGLVLLGNPGTGS